MPPAAFAGEEGQEQRKGFDSIQEQETAVAPSDDNDVIKEKLEQTKIIAAATSALNLTNPMIPPPPLKATAGELSPNSSSFLLNLSSPPAQLDLAGKLQEMSNMTAASSRYA